MSDPADPVGTVAAWQAARATASGALPCDDWDVLFVAVLGRLHHGGDAGPRPALSQAEVDECVQALQQLQRAVQQERRLRLRLERELRHSRGELADLRRMLAADVHGTPLHDSAGHEAWIGLTAS